MIEADLVIHDIGQLVTCEPAQGEGVLGLLENAAVAAKDSHIVWVGPSGRWQWRIEVTPDVVVLDAHGACVMPGFVDARTDVLWAGLRADEHAARLRGQPFWGGGIMRSVRLTRGAADGELRDAARRRLGSFLRHGVTALEMRSGYGLSADHEERLLRIASDLAEETPMRLVSTFMGAHVAPDGIPGDEYIGLVVDEMLPRCRPLAQFCEAWCDPGAFDADQCRRVLGRAQQLGYALKVQGSQVAPGDGPRIAVEMGAATVEQLNYLRDGDARMLAESAVVCVVCPGSTVNLRLAGEAAARTLAAAGCQLALATDYNPGTSCTENMCLMVGLGCLELGLSPEEAIRAATLGGARALRLQRQCGSVRLGKRCDLVFLDAESYLEIPYRLGVNLVERTVCQGRLVEPGD